MSANNLCSAMSSNSGRSNAFCYTYAPQGITGKVNDAYRASRNATVAAMVAPQDTQAVPAGIPARVALKQLCEQALYLQAHISTHRRHAASVLSRCSPKIAPAVMVRGKAGTASTSKQAYAPMNATYPSGPQSSTAVTKNSMKALSGSFSTTLPPASSATPATTPSDASTLAFKPEIGDLASSVASTVSVVSIDTRCASACGLSCGLPLEAHKEGGGGIEVGSGSRSEAGAAWRSVHGPTVDAEPLWPTWTSLERVDARGQPALQPASSLVRTLAAAVAGRCCSVGGRFCWLATG